MRAGRQIPLLHIVDLQRPTKGNRANLRGRTIHVRLATELLAANNRGTLYIPIIKLYSSVINFFPKIGGTNKFNLTTSIWVESGT